jgi:acyl carrier protein
MPDQDDVTQRVMQVIATAQHLEPAAVTETSTFEELHIDSLDGINILFALENEFNVNIPDEEAQKLRSVSEIAEGIRKLLEAKAGSAGAAV